MTALLDMIQTIEQLMKERVDSFEALVSPTVKDIEDKDEFISLCLKTRDALNELYKFKAKQK